MCTLKYRSPEAHILICYVYIYTNIMCYYIQIYTFNVNTPLGRLLVGLFLPSHRKKKKIECLTINTIKKNETKKMEYR